MRERGRLAANVAILGFSEVRATIINTGTSKRGRNARRKPGSSAKRKEELIRRNVERFREVLVFKAHRLLYHSTLGLRVIKKKKNEILSTNLEKVPCKCLPLVL